MRAYSIDLRERIVVAVCRCEASLREIAEAFSVSLSFIVRLLRRWRGSGTVEPRPHGGGHPRALSQDAEQRLRQLVHDQPDATLAELRQRLGLSCSVMAIVRALQRLRITRKKKVLRAQEQDTPQVQAQRQEFKEKVASVELDHLIYVDETGATTAMTRRYGRAPQGERVIGTVPNHWHTTTLISAVRLGGVGPSLAFEGATDTQAFQTYVEQVLVPELQAGDVVIWDNLQPHKNVEVVRAITQAQAEVVPLPPHSPDLNPIEKMFSKVKEKLRSLAARTTEGVYQAMGTALEKVTPKDIVGWFQSCDLCPIHP